MMGDKCMYRVGVFDAEENRFKCGVYTSGSQIFLNNATLDWPPYFSGCLGLTLDAAPVDVVTMLARKDFKRLGETRGGSTSQASSSSQSFVTCVYQLCCRNSHHEDLITYYGLYSDMRNAMANIRTHSDLNYDDLMEIEFSITEIQLNTTLKYWTPEPTSWRMSTNTFDDAPYEIQWVEIREGKRQLIRGAP